MAKLNFVSRGEGTAIIFVHGLGESLESWSEQLEHFGAEGFRAVALDLRGHGHSEAGEARIEMEGFADDVFEALRSLSIEKAHFCGLSMGALVVLEAYKRNPGAFLSMTLVSSLPQYPPAQTQALENMSMRELGEQVAKFAVGPAATTELKKSIARVVGSTSKTAYIQSAEAACARDYTPVLSTIKVPVLLVAGELGFVAPPQAAAFMQKRIANSSLVIVRGAGHLPNREAPREFDRLLDEFLRTVGKGATP
jgi:pimeloyl-ACP methyl ester carboxylesterase